MMEIEKFKTTFCSVFAKGKIVPHLKEGEYPACIQAFPLDGNTALHYELIQRAKDGDVFLEFHVERAHYWEYEKEVRLLQDKFNTYGRDISFSTYYSSQVWKCRRPVRTESDLEEDARRMKGVVGACLKSADEKLDDGGRHEGTLQVGIAQVRLFELLHWKLRMPPIQREYCWTTENVKRLLSDLCNWRKHHKYLKYHLGSVILKEMAKATKSMWWGIIISSALFAIIHINPIQIVFAMPAGIFLGWIYCKTGSLLVPICIHIINNSISFVLMSVGTEGEGEFSLNSTLGVILLISFTLICVVSCIWINRYYAKIRKEQELQQAAVVEESQGDSSTGELVE